MQFKDDLKFETKGGICCIKSDSAWDCDDYFSMCEDLLPYSLSVASVAATNSAAATDTHVAPHSAHMTGHHHVVQAPLQAGGAGDARSGSDAAADDDQFLLTVNYSTPAAATASNKTIAACKLISLK